ncbi:recombinase family protein [Bacillus sp. FJAT-45350]|uniref:recombinase family protein n=1 Tax=Bacillus sp. FJAT-45350 TaxID=2011014 RepID=UPI000BB89895|nr:recombinase family protein [Bacillus sp. FJAT-45350]
MPKKFAYLGARKFQELELFKGVAKADHYYIDLVDNAGRSDLKELTKMLETVDSSDTVIIQSFTNFTSSLQQIYEYIMYFKQKDIKLVILDQTFNEKAFLTETGFQILKNVLELQTEFDREENYRSKKAGRGSYPNGFYEAFVSYKNGEQKANDAAESLNIPIHQFYNAVRAFS